jgi:hypothetical protein
MKSKNWFDVSREGLAKILERKGKEFILYELVQNAWDEPGVTIVDVTLEYRGYNEARLTISDDAPDGFKDLSHAYTLFAESAKKANPEQRGRFNFGEKLVLALAKDMAIETTTGTIIFDRKGRYVSKTCRKSGSVITANLKLTKQEVDHILSAANRLIRPFGIKTIINGIALAIPETLAGWKATLPTEIADSEGKLRSSERLTLIELFTPANNETGWLYEMGIPVCETGDKYDYNVNQKVPLTMDRDNVLPSYLRKLRTTVFNHMADKIGVENINDAWVADALESPDVTPEAVSKYADQKFGVKRVAYDPSDAEANKIAVSQGYQVVYGGALSASAWGHLKSAGAIQSAGQVTPSAKAWSGEGNPDAKICPQIPREKWTSDMIAVDEYARRVALVVLNASITVQFYSTPHLLGSAAYGGCVLQFNKMRLGADWFDLAKNREAIDDLLIHEFGHHYSMDHLSSEFYKALTGIASRFIQAVRRGVL